MKKALLFLKEKAFTKAQKKQAEALALLENGLLALSEKMRKSLMAAQTPLK